MLQAAEAVVVDTARRRLLLLGVEATPVVGAEDIIESYEL